MRSDHVEVVDFCMIRTSGALLNFSPRYIWIPINILERGRKPCTNNSFAAGTERVSSC
jgi:hypothetical protein